MALDTKNTGRGLQKVILVEPWYGWLLETDRQTESPIRLGERSMKKRLSRGYNELQVSTQPQLFTEGKSGKKWGWAGVLAANTHTHTHTHTENSYSVLTGPQTDRWSDTRACTRAPLQLTGVSSWSHWGLTSRLTAVALFLFFNRVTSLKTFMFTICIWESTRLTRPLTLKLFNAFSGHEGADASHASHAKAESDWAKRKVQFSPST